MTSALHTASLIPCGTAHRQPAAQTTPCHRQNGTPSTHGGSGSSHEPTPTNRQQRATRRGNGQLAHEANPLPGSPDRRAEHSPRQQPATLRRSSDQAMTSAQKRGQLGGVRNASSRLLALGGTAQVSPIDIWPHLFARHRAARLPINVYGEAFATGFTVGDVPHMAKRCSAARRKTRTLRYREIKPITFEFVHAVNNNRAVNVLQ